MSRVPPFPRTKLDVVRRLSMQTGLTQAQVSSVLDSLAALSYEGARRPGGFHVPGFGRLELSQRKARDAWDPRRRKAIRVPAKTTVSFRLSEAAKSTILAGIRKSPAERKA